MTTGPRNMKSTANQKILDQLFESAATKPRSVTAKLLIEGGDAGHYEMEFVVNQRVMTRLTDFIRELDDDYPTR